MFLKHTFDKKDKIEVKKSENMTLNDVISSIAYSGLQRLKDFCFRLPIMVLVFAKSLK